MYKKILVPLDGSRRAEAILPHVIELADHLASTVLLLNVVEPIVTNVSPYPTMISFDAEVFTRQTEWAKGYLADCAAELSDRGIHVETIVEHGPVVSSIVEVAKRHDADLIAIASHGRTGLARAFYGSVAAGLLNQADRPMLLIRADT